MAAMVVEEVEPKIKLAATGAVEAMSEKQA
jgi:hypothetical protein